MFMFYKRFDIEGERKFNQKVKGTKRYFCYHKQAFTYDYGVSQ